MSFADIKWNPPDKDLRVFAALLIPFCGGVAYLLRQRGIDLQIASSIVAVGAAIGVVGLVSPAHIRWIYVGWMLAMTPISIVVTYLIMAFVFYAVIWPISLLMRARDRDLLRLKLDRAASTYWERRSPPTDPRRYFRQY